MRVMQALQTALVLLHQGRLAEAEALCERLDVQNPHRHGILTLRAQLRLDAGRAAAAISDLEEIARIAPRDAANLRRLGAALLSVGRTAAAVETLRRAVAAEPANIRGHNNLGQALLQLRELPEAAACFARALELDSHYPVARFNLALAFEALDRPVEALQQLDVLLELQPAHAAGWARRAPLQWRLGRPADALRSLDAAAALQSEDGAALALRAAVLLSLERGPEALAAADSALAKEPGSIEALQYRAAAFSQLHRDAEALRCLEHVLGLDPGNAEAWCNCAVIHLRLGDWQNARRCYGEAQRLDPGNLSARTGLLASCLPPVPAAPGERQGREDFMDALAALERWLDGRQLREAHAWALAQQPFFYLSYQEYSNRELLERYRSRSAAALASYAAARPRHVPPPSTVQRRVRLGIVSAQVCEHSVFRALTRGWLEQLDRDAFEIVVFHLGARQDDATALARRCADRFEAGPRNLPDWARAISEAAPDALLYPEVGIDRGTLALASLRLAPRQLVAWGHPETSGLPTMDAFISAEAFEPAGAEADYSERLVRLPHLGVHLAPPTAEPAKLDLESLGIRRDAPWYVCAGTPYKYDPVHDSVWVEIARRVRDCTLVFFEYERPALSERLRRRLELAFASAGLDPSRQLRWIPWQPRPVFRALLAHASGYLDTIGFSGFNTLMMAVDAGLPCVAHEGRFLRGRLGSGILRHLGMDELVAADTAGYIELAARLGIDPGYRSQVAARLRAAAPRAYGDVTAIRALERCLAERD